MAVSNEARSKMLTPNFVNTLDYTNRFLPNKDLDSTIKRISKWVLIIFTLGLIFIIPLTMDLSKNLFNKLFSKDLHPKSNDITDDSTKISNTTNSPINTSSTNLSTSSINASFKNIFNIENITKIFKSTIDGLKSIPEQSNNYLSNPQNDRYHNIGYLFGKTIPFWLAGGFLKGSAVSILFNATGYLISITHKKIMSTSQELK